MRFAMCWGGPLDRKTHAVFNRPTFSVQNDQYTLIRLTYRERPTFTVFECSVWLAKSADPKTLDGAEIIPLYRARGLPYTTEKVSPDAPCWPRKECPECNGRGKIEDGFQESSNVCAQCDGAGKVLA